MQTTHGQGKILMVTINAWPSVSIKWAETIITSQKIVKCEWSDTLGTIVEWVDRNLSHEVVEKVIVMHNSWILSTKFR